MLFKINESIKILERTPLILEILLSDLDVKWIINNEGPDTWSPYDVIGHLIHGEKTDWIPRMLIILGEGKNKRFTPYDRFAQFEESRGKTLVDLLSEFEILRSNNLRILKEINFTEDLLGKKGIHPEFGEVTLKQLLATWAVHDLGHLSQVTRVMAKQYEKEMGPWVKYFSIFSKS
jgi:hypothetical protein